MKNFNSIAILGPTASGKTGLAVQLADQLDGEILSIDARQIYKQLDIGTGKDLKSYEINGKTISHHLINISEPGINRNLLYFYRAFNLSFDDVLKRRKTPVLCGGTGMYLETVLEQKSLVEAPDNLPLRDSLANLEKAELLLILEKLKPFLNDYSVDYSSTKRIIRAIEIGTFQQENGIRNRTIEKVDIKSIIFGLDPPVEKRRAQITKRLHDRINEGLIAEVEQLLVQYGSEFLFWCGLEYRFIAQYLENKISLENCISQLETAIHQYAKRQMTWFRKMERSGYQINWLDTELNSQQQAEAAMSIIRKLAF